MSTDENKAIVRRLFEELWTAKRVDRVDELVARDYIDGSALPGQAPGLEGAKQKWAMYIAAAPDAPNQIDDLVAEADKVAVRWTAAGTHQGRLLGIPPTRKRFRVGGISIYRLAEGTIAECWEQFDRLGLLRQLGAMPRMQHAAPGAPGSRAPDAGSTSRARPSVSIEENKAIVRRFHEEVFNERRVDRAEALFTQAYLDHGALPGQAPGLAGAKRKWATYIAAIAGHIWTEDLVAEGDRVAARWRVAGTHGGELLGIPATGNQLQFSGLSIYRLVDGKIAEQWEQWDKLGLLQQLGALRASPPAAARA